MTRVSLTIILAIGALVLLDGTGIFMYFSYLPVFVLALLGMGATFISLGRLRPHVEGTRCGRCLSAS